MSSSSNGSVLKEKKNFLFSLSSDFKLFQIFFLSPIRSHYVVISNTILDSVILIKISYSTMFISRLRSMTSANSFTHILIWRLNSLKDPNDSMIQFLSYRDPLRYPFENMYLQDLMSKNHWIDRDNDSKIHLDILLSRFEMNFLTIDILSRRCTIIVITTKFQGRIFFSVIIKSMNLLIRFSKWSIYFAFIECIVSSRDTSVVILIQKYIRFLQTIETSFFTLTTSDSINNEKYFESYWRLRQ